MYVTPKPLLHIQVFCYTFRFSYTFIRWLRFPRLLHSSLCYTLPSFRFTLMHLLHTRIHAYATHSKLCYVPVEASTTHSSFCCTFKPLLHIQVFRSTFKLCHTPLSLCYTQVFCYMSMCLLYFPFSLSQMCHIW